MNPFKRKNGQVVSSVVLDTSGLIDGRIVEIAKAGFVPQNVVVPQFVIAELQFLADHGDTHKRERARYGLDVIRELQDVRRIEVSIAREKFENIREVDDKLVALAKQYGSHLYTTDFNLNKVAQIEGVQVLNVNELAHALRPNLLPGEIVHIKLTQVGQDKTQGVGYLGDGTMVVVEQASRYVGQQIQAVCTRILQTQAGKMMFAKLASNLPPAQRPAELRVDPKSVEAPQAKPAPAPKAVHFPAASSAPQRPAPKPRAEGPRQAQPRDTSEVLQPIQTPQAPAEQPRNNQRRRGGSGNNAGTPKPTANQAPQRAQKAPRQPQNNNTRKPQVQPQQGGNARGAQGGGQRRRRLSPEDSLLATLKEIQQ